MAARKAPVSLREMGALLLPVQIASDSHLRRV
jgi:hypothetical protein